MFVKTTFKGMSMVKYWVGALIIKLLLIGAFIMASIPHGIEIIDHVQTFANTTANLELYFILGQIGWIFLNLIGAIVLEIVIIFGMVIPMANSELKSRW